jgi:hypothetical protein
MIYNVHPFQRAHEARTDYLIYSNTLLPFGRENLGEALKPYQKQQEMYYYTRQINPLSLLKLGPEFMDPSNRQPDVRPTLYQGISLDYLQKRNQYQTPENNPYLWQDNKPAKPYYSINDPLQPGPRQQSSMVIGQKTSFIPFHGMQLY